jgi:cbb3-type cytochrome oxidase maturation protein
MSVLVILIAASILIAGGFLTAFLWSVRNGQFDDDYTPSVRMLFEAVNSPSDNAGEAAVDPSTKQQSDT